MTRAATSTAESRDIRSVVVMRFEQNGELTVHIADPEGSCIVLTVDERCPDDLVYEHLTREPPADVLALAPHPWGYTEDDKHDQARARVLGGKGGLSVIEGGAVSTPKGGAE